MDDNQLTLSIPEIKVASKHHLPESTDRSLQSNSSKQTNFNLIIKLYLSQVQQLMMATWTKFTNTYLLWKMMALINSGRQCDVRVTRWWLSALLLRPPCWRVTVWFVDLCGVLPLVRNWMRNVWCMYNCTHKKTNVGKRLTASTNKMY